MPIIDALLERNAEVVIAGDGRSLLLLRDRYPALPYIELPSYGMNYAKGENQVFKLLGQARKLIRAASGERQVLEKAIDSHGINLVISDNRYGLWSKRVPNVVISHQLLVRLPGILAPLEGLGYAIHKHFLRRFDTLWVPDLPGDDNLSGDHTHRYALPAHGEFIGPLSRFRTDMPLPEAFSYPELAGTPIDVAVVISGPEPQRTIFEEMVAEQAKLLPRQVMVVQGKTESRSVRKDGNLTFVSFMGSEDLALLFSKASVVISRSGYTSIMDYASLGLRQVVQVPTPGQTEQEYLGERLMAQGIAVCYAQRNFQLARALEEVVAYRGFHSMTAHARDFEPALDRALARVK